MLLSERQSEILHRARSQGRVEVEALAAEFEVTTQTIRRDLNDLSLNGLLARVHGGAVPAPTDYVHFVRGAPAATRMDGAEQR